MPCLMLLPLALFYGLVGPPDLGADTLPEDQGFVCGTHRVQPAGSGPAAKVAVPVKTPIVSQDRVKILVVFAQFRDEAPGDETIPAYTPDLFDPARPGSMAHFYQTMSLGRFQVEGEVAPRRYRARQPAAAYLAESADKPGRFDRFVQEILAQVDEEVDLRRFDNDGPDGVPDSGDDDGWVDYLYVKVRSTPPGFLRGRATGIARLGPPVLYTSQRLGRTGAAIQVNGGTEGGAISREGSFAQTVGVMAHEFGHALGLPDLYDQAYDTPAEDSAGIGQWGLMGWGAHGWNGNDGPNPFSAWSLEQLGWLGGAAGRLVEVEGDVASLEVTDVHAGGSVVKIPLQVTTTSWSWRFQEYLLLEQRVRGSTYYNRHLPAEGLLVWHIQPSYFNDDEQAKQVDLVCADGLYQDAGYPTGQAADGRHGRDNLDFWAHDTSYRQTHQGNLGDATDVFDGVRFTRLAMDTNPSTDPQGLLSAASTGLALAMQRQGEKMQVEVVYPRWSGTITEAVHWSGTVLVDGDLRVAPEGALVVYPPARVRFAGRDRRGEGRDPSLIELHLQGNFSIAGRRRSAAAGGDKVIFEALKPAERWYGIVLDPAVEKSILFPDGRYELRQVEHGFVFPDALSGAGRRGLQTKFHLVDQAGLTTAGNGDGRLAPGETFQLEVEVGNGSLEMYRKLLVELSCLPPARVYPAWRSTGSRWWRHREGFALYAGGRHALQVPPLTLSPEARPGEEVYFILTVGAEERGRIGDVLAQDTFSFRVEGRYPAPQLRFEVPGRAVVDQAVALYPDRPNPIRVVAQDEVERLDLVVYALGAPAPQSEIPLRLEEGGPELVFAGTFQPPGAGFYRLVPRVRSSAGEEVFSSTVLLASAILADQSAPVLVFLDEGYSSGEKSRLRTLFADMTQEQGTTAYFLDVASQEGRAYETILRQAADEGSVVFWLKKGRNRMDWPVDAALRDFLKRGGRLFLASSNFHSFYGRELFQEVFHVKVSRGPRSDLLHIPLLGASFPGFSALHYWLEPMHPAVPILFNSTGEVAGVAVDVAGYRAMYLPFDLTHQTTLGSLLKTSLAFLRQEGVEKAVLEPSENVVVADEGLWLMAERTARVRARVKGPVAAADLQVYTTPEMKPVMQVPMQRVEEQAGEQVFAATFEPPDPRHYQLFVQLRTADHQSLLNGASVWVVRVLSERGVLVLVGDQYNEQQKGALQESLDPVLQEMGLEANLVDLDLIAENEALYEALLGQHRGADKLVLWLGMHLDQGSQAAFRRFLARGGRLLIASRSAKQISGLLADLFHTEIDFRGNDTSLQAAGLLTGTAVALTVNHAVLRPGLEAVPLLRDETGEVAGLYVEEEAHRAIYLPFDMGRITRASIRTLLAATLPLLHRAEGRVRLLLEPADFSPLRALRPFAPQAVVVNAGGGGSEAFQVGYQILQDQEVVAAFDQEEPPLKGHAVRTVALPAWTPQRPGPYQIRLGLDPTGQGHLIYQPALSFHLLDVGPPFEQAALPEAAVSYGQGAALFDYDGDGDLDAYLVRRGGRANALLRNEGDGFTDQAEAAGLAIQDRGRGLALGDYDGDGDLDLYLVQAAPNRMLRNDGGTFVEVTAALEADPQPLAPLADKYSGSSAAFFDAEGDGDLDLYLVNATKVNRFFRHEAGAPPPGAHARVTPRFREAAAAVGLADTRWGRGLALGDVDGDGDVDLFVANVQGGSRLYRNEGAETGQLGFVDESAAAGLARFDGDLGAVFGDVDGDGDADLFVANNWAANRLYHNEGPGLFAPVAAAAVGRRSMGAAFFDYDGDGAVDLATTAVGGQGGDEVYQNQAGAFWPVGALLGLQPQSDGQALSYGDIDGDGDVDWLVADVRGSRLYRNPAGPHHWLQVALEQGGLNRHGLGARIEVVAGSLRQHRQVHSGYGYGSQVAPRVYFGLGFRGEVDTLRVVWPDGQEGIQVEVGVDQLLRWRRADLPTSVAAAVGLPGVFALGPNYPNPFNARTILPYQLPQRAWVQLTIYNVAGQPVRRLVHQEQRAGSYRIEWDGRDKEGRAVGSGVYLYRLQAGSHQQTRRILLLK